MQAISDNLIHFLDKQNKNSPHKQFETFRQIIEIGLRFGPVELNFGARSVNNCAICFTDIPLALCNAHTARYGKFGIGFKKSSLKNCGGHPVRYYINERDVKSKSVFYDQGSVRDHLKSHLELLCDISDRLSDPRFALYDHSGKEVFDHSRLQRWAKEQMTILSLEKETSETGLDLDSIAKDIYYREREWRLIPLEGNLSASVQRTPEGEYYFRFTRQDVNMIVTPSDEIRVEVLRFLLGLENHTDQRLKQFAENPPPILIYDDLQAW